MGTESSAQTLEAGSYSFNATYNGDGNYLGSASTCEPLTVEQAYATTMTVSRDAADATVEGVAPGTAVHDSATVSGVLSGLPITGTVTYSCFSTNDCPGSTVFALETVDVGTEASSRAATRVARFFRGT